MKKTIILGLSVVGITLNAVNSFADSDDQNYPATNFQPKVIFLDKDAVKAPENKATFDPKYPAANFQPKVLYIDKSSATPAKEKAVFDPKYPATNFEPKVIFPAG
jgi:hypothetical protein